MFSRGAVLLALVVVLVATTTTTTGGASADVPRDDDPPPRRVQDDDGGDGGGGDRPTYSPANYTSYSPTIAPRPIGDDDKASPRPATIEPTTTADGSSYPPTTADVGGGRRAPAVAVVVVRRRRRESHHRRANDREYDGGRGGGAHDRDGRADPPLSLGRTDRPTDRPRPWRTTTTTRGGGAPPPVVAVDGPTEAPPPFVDDDDDDVDPTIAIPPPPTTIATTTDPAPDAPTDGPGEEGEGGEGDDGPAAPAKGPTFDLTSSFPPTHARRRGPFRWTGLKMTLIGIGKIESVPDWEKTTSGFFKDVYDNERPGGMYDVMVGVTMTGVNNLSRRGMQSVVTYAQETWYSIDGSDWKPDDDFVLVPLSTGSRRDEYVGTLMSLSGYEYLTDVSEISAPLLTTGGVLGISVLCGVMFGSFFYWLPDLLFMWSNHKLKNGRDEGDRGG